MGVMMQAFYWDCPRHEGKEYAWWPHVKERVPSLSAVGFTALWLPPVSKAANIGGPSMGYDPYDYYDLGDLDQKGAVKTWFGSKTELAHLIESAHVNRMQVYADIVINHNNGADNLEKSGFDGEERWTRFSPASTRFARNWQHFHPSHYESWDDETFGGMPDLCHRHPYVYTELIEYARWLLEDIGFDGFRYDMVKGYGGWMVRAIQELRALRDQNVFKPFGVGECWDNARVIEDWLAETNAWSDNPASAFDFPLRYKLKRLCEDRGFSLRHLAERDSITYTSPERAVTFVENHDVVRDDPIVNDKMLAYAVILTHEGYPCVFWQDYYTWELGQEGWQSGIAALVRTHEDCAGGPTETLYLDDSLYVMQRPGAEGKPGLVLVLNTRNEWRGEWVHTAWQNRCLVPAAFRGSGNTGVPHGKWTTSGGWVDLWAPPRGYAVYVPE